MTAEAVFAALAPVAQRHSWGVIGASARNDREHVARWAGYWGVLERVTGLRERLGPIR